METLNKIKSWKEGACLHFERDGKRLEFDFRDNSFYRITKTGVRKAVQNARPFFRNLSGYDIADSFDNPVYRDYVRIVAKAEYRLKNLASMFAELETYSHLEQYLAVGIKGVGHRTVTEPVSIYPKEVLQFLIEGEMSLDRYGWEKSYLHNKELVVNLVTYVRSKYRMDLEVYRWLFGLVADGGIETFQKLITPSNQTLAHDGFRYNYTYTYYGNRNRDEVPSMGYGCEYKTLFDYLIKVDRREALPFYQALGYYSDYLKMAREMIHGKYFDRLREQNPEILRKDYPNLGYNRIEKYPTNLKMRHDIVARNYKDFSTAYDEVIFAEAVDTSYEYKWGAYQMVAPKVTKDIRDEGNTLNHCVASYISRVLDGTTQILFMRESAEESLVTVEVRNKAIVQARGYNNRSVTQVEKKWLETYAKARNLDYGLVRRNENLPTPYVKEKEASLDASLSQNGGLVELVRGQVIA